MGSFTLTKAVLIFLTDARSRLVRGKCLALTRNNDSKKEAEQLV